MRRSVAAVVFLCAACAPRAPEDPDPSAFEPNAYFGIDPVASLPDRGAVGPHDESGLRGASLDRAASRRVLVLGGGAVYGAGAPASESLPARLAAELAKRGAAASVGNAGCPGHCAASALLRYQFRLATLGATHIVYVAGEEDRRVYASSAFVPDLNHAPRPWTGKPWPASGDLAPAGAKAFARDVESLAILARAEKAAFVVALPESPDFAGFARAVSGAVAATPAAVAQVLLAR